MTDVDELSRALRSATADYRLPTGSGAAAWKRGRRRQRRRVAGASASAVVVTVALAVALLQARPDRPAELRVTAPPPATPAASPTPSASPTATSTFVSDAELAAAQWYSVASTSARKPVAGHPDYTVWLGRDGQTHIGDADFKAADEQGPTTYQVANSDELTWAELSSVTTDPEALRTRLGAGNRPDLIDKDALQLLGTSPAPLALRQALITVLSQGAVITPGVHDDLGRPASKISLVYYDAGGDRLADDLYVDQDHARLLEESSNGYPTTFLSWGTTAPPVK